VGSRTRTETFVLTLKRAVAALDGMKSVAVSVPRPLAARDGMKSVAAYRAVSGWFVLMAVTRQSALALSWVAGWPRVVAWCSADH
jgi:hypothetical protein